MLTESSSYFLEGTIGPSFWKIEAKSAKGDPIKLLYKKKWIKPWLKEVESVVEEKSQFKQATKLIGICFRSSMQNRKNLTESLNSTPLKSICTQKTSFKNVNEKISFPTSEK